jgi:hypothetical protein
MDRRRLQGSGESVTALGRHVVIPQ